MKVACELYINGNKVDIINSEQFAQQFAITYSFSDLYEPDKLIDTYSKSITLPGTPNNNAIFGNIWKLDSNNIEKFNPSQLSDFQIFLNNELWQSGTVQLNEITTNNNLITYKITLFGSITRIMSILMNSDIDDPNNKLLRNLKYPYKLMHMLNPETLHRFWNGSYYDYNTQYCDYMNYIPCNNGLYDNFNSNKALKRVYGYSTPYKITDYLTNAALTVSSGDQNFDEYTTTEYRIEYQRPAMKINKLIEQIVKDCRTDASINLDSDFFNSSNPYWYNTYLTLGQYTTEADEGEVSGTLDNYNYRYLSTSDSSTYFDLKFTQQDGAYTIFAPDSSTVVYFGNLHGSKKLSLEFMIRVTAMSSLRIPNEDKESTLLNGYYDPSYIGTIFNTSRWTKNTWTVRAYASTNNGYYYKNSTPYTNGAYDSSVHSGIYAYNNDYIRNYCYYDGINNNYPNYKYQYTLQNTDLVTNWPAYTPTSDPNLTWKPFKLDIDVTSLPSDGYIRLYIENIDHRFVAVQHEYYEPDRPSQGPARWRAWAYGNYNFPVLLYLSHITAVPNGTSTSSMNNYFPYSYGYIQSSANVSYNKAIRSGDNYGGTYSGVAPAVVDITDMFDVATTQGDILINYTKILGLLYETDRLGNITIESKNKFFENYSIIDWSDKIDYSKEMKITPLTFNTKYYEMNYKDGDTYYENKYKGEFGLDYGVKRINTGYAFNSSPIQNFNTIFTNTVMSKDIKRVYEIDASNNIVYKLKEPASLPAYYKKNDNTKERTEGKYNLLFRNGSWPSTTGIDYWISADSSVMLDETLDNGGEYCWWSKPDLTNGNGVYSQLRSYIPLWTTHYSNYSWDFGYPRISYEGATTDSYSPGSTVYSRFWEEYLTELYNVKNRILTCYVKLSWLDVFNFSFKNFVIINGVLYHPNKLINVNPLSDDPVQVELIQVQNIDAYTGGQRIPGGTVQITRASRRMIMEIEPEDEGGE